jgi:hypothetical protein
VWKDGRLRKEWPGLRLGIMDDRTGVFIKVLTTAEVAALFDLTPLSFHWLWLQQPGGLKTQDTGT